jgi:predicted nucleic acid-binding protein
VGGLILVLDTTFLVLHYFSNDEGTLTKTRETLRISRKLGNRAILPTIVLAEFYAQTYKRTGKEVADKHFREVVNSGLTIIPLTEQLSYQAGLLRAKYQEKVPWGDCIVAATAVQNKARFVVTEDPHLMEIKEIEARRNSELRL